MQTIIMRLFLKICGIKVGPRSKFRGFSFIMRRKTSSIEIGSDFACNSSFFSNLIGLYQRTIIVARKNGKIQIGNHVGISGATIHGSNITIGDYVVIGANTKIIDHDFHSIHYVERRTDEQTNVVTRPIRIGDDVFRAC